MHNVFDSRHPAHALYAGRLLKDMQKLAGDQPVSGVEMHADRSWFVFTTELGMYRVADHYPNRVDSKGYSVNLQTWYVKIVPVKREMA